MKTGKKLALYFAAALVVTGAAFAASLAVGRYPIDWAQLAADGMDRRVFFTLRLPRTCMALLAGFALGISGGVYQTRLARVRHLPRLVLSCAWHQLYALPASGEVPR